MSPLRFECTQCARCCTNRGEYAYVYLNDEESRDLAEHLGLRRREFERRYTFVDEDGWRQLRFEDERCVFLTDDGRCSVYPARPTQCRTFPFWPEMIRDGRWTPAARELCEGVGKGPVYTREEADVLVRAFAESTE
jgi:Fe-S-cluster containining protein